MSCVAYYRERDFQVSTLFVEYGQLSARREAAAAKAIASALEVPLAVLRVEGLSIPTGEIRGRNGLLLMMGLMVFEGSGLLSLGIHAGTTYADCSPAFLAAMQRVLDTYSNGRIQLDAPFLDWHKGSIYEFAKTRTLPLEFAYSCELGLDQPCGECVSCLDLEALHAR
jgi:7-cyano-7-deazaguanine synthase